MNFPCKDCEERHEGCWGKCEKYKKAQEQTKQEKLMRNREYEFWNHGRKRRYQ